MSSYVIGTAGHIDHGKSALVKVLTGIDPDRLKEEKEREMTIDLGFAYLTLPSGQKVGIVDVPGHERFIRNMLAGATGIDLVLFVVAADEGMMPQSKEHLEILELLAIKKGIIVVTKIDLVEEDWLSLIVSDINEAVKGTFLQGAPIVFVSTKKGKGITELKQKIDEMLTVTPTRDWLSPTRFPIDRVFTMAGFGTVVTGTLWEGKIKVGDTLELLPQGKTVRIRNIQSHKEKVKEGEAGTRLALNLVGVSKSEVKRGDVLCQPFSFKPTSLIDVYLKFLQDAPALKHGERVHFYLGTTEDVAVIRLLDREEIRSGQEVFAQLRLSKPLIAKRFDRFVVRRFSPLVTIGGGVVLEPYAQRKRRYDDSQIENLKMKMSGAVEEIIKEILMEAKEGGLSLNEITLKLGLPSQEVFSFVESLQIKQEIFKIGERFFHYHFYNQIREEIIKRLESHFNEKPLSTGMLKEELRTGFKKVDRKTFALLLEELERGGLVFIKGEKITLPTHKPFLSEKEKSIKEKIVEMYRENLFSPPSLEKVKETFVKDGDLAEELFKVLVEEKVLIKVASGIYFHSFAIAKARELITSFLKENGSITPAQFRDIIGSSRKFVLPLLEYFDKLKLTKRIGDKRILH